MSALEEDKPRVVNIEDVELAKMGGTADNETTGDDRVLSEESIALARKTNRKLLLKIDSVLVTFAALLYLAAYLDRSNLGNARLQGLEKTVLGGDDSKFSLALACFFITYITLSIPATVLAKAIPANRSIAIGAIIWSVAASAQAAVKNPAGIYTTRLFIGVGESMFGQAIPLYLSYWYPRDQLARRVGFFVSSGATAGAFGGLIAYGVQHINSKIDQWRILFLIEGLPSVALGVIALFFLPGRPQTTRFLTEPQRELVLAKLEADSGGESEDRVDWKGVRRGLIDWKGYLTAVMYSCMNLGLGSVSSFLPTIVKELGYTNAKAQLLTVPPYAVAFVTMVIITNFSDRFRTRGLPVATIFSIGILGWAILYAVPASHPTASEIHARYFGTICVVVAGYCAIPLIITWTSNNTGSQSQRAVALGLLNTVGQCLSVLATYSFPSNEAPRYIRGTVLNLAFQCLGFSIAIFFTLYYRFENRRRDRVEGKPQVGYIVNVIEGHDLARGFRYMV